MAAPQIHPSAFVAPTAQLGDDVIVGPCAVIEDDVVIGARTRIDAFASVKRYTTMGEDNHIYSYAAVGGEPQDLKFHGEVSSLVIGNRNNIREFTTLHRGTEAGGGVTRVGDNNLLMAYVAAGQFYDQFFTGGVAGTGPALRGGPHGGSKAGGRQHLCAGTIAGLDNDGGLSGCGPSDAGDAEQIAGPQSPEQRSILRALKIFPRQLVHIDSVLRYGMLLHGQELAGLVLETRTYP